MAYPSLEFFLVIAKYKSLTKASQELFVTQQNLSSYLKRLESYYGLELFTRHPKFELTEFGKILYQEALEIQNIYQRIDVSKKSYTSNCELRLGCRAAHPNDYVDLLPLQKYKAAHPQVKFIFTEYTSSLPIQKVQEGSLDFAFSSSYVNCDSDSSLLRVTMRKDHCYVLIHVDLLLQYFPENLEEKIACWKSGIALRELNGVPYFSLTKTKSYNKMDVMNDYLRKNNLIESKMGECYSRAGALNMCRHAMCYFVSGDPEPESDDFFSFPVIEPDTAISLYCYCNSHVLNRPYINDFWNIIKTASLKE